MPLRETAGLMLLLDTGVRVGEATPLEWGPRAGCRVGCRWMASQVSGWRLSAARPKRYVDRERMAAPPAVLAVFLSHEGVPLSASAATHHVIKIVYPAGVHVSKCGSHTFELEFIHMGGDLLDLQRIHAEYDAPLRSPSGQ